MSKHSTTHRPLAAKKRKNFLPTLIITVFLWLFLAGLIYFVDPTTFGAVFLFFLLIFLVLLFTFSIILVHTRRSLILSLSLTLFLIFRYFGVGNILNFLLLLGLGITTEIYFSKKF